MMNRGNETDVIAEAMAAALMVLAGGQESEKINKASLVAMGTRDLKIMAIALIKSLNSSIDNTTILGKLERYAKQLSSGELLYNENDLNAEADRLHIDALLMNLLPAEMLADITLKIAGLQGKGGIKEGLMHEDLQAKYPDMNKASLVKLGKENLLKLLTSFAKSEGKRNLYDNRTPIEKLDRLRRKLGGESVDNEGIFKYSLKESIKQPNPKK